jgi:thiol-disulfide isomerase/thioredoxin
MRRSSLGFVVLALGIASGLAAPLLPPARAQEHAQDSDERARAQIQGLLEQAMDHMAAAGGLLARAKGLEGAEAERVRADGLGAYDEACAKYQTIVTLVDQLSAPDTTKAQVRSHCHYNTACARSVQGRKDEALAAFGLCLDEGYDSFDLIAHDPDLDPIRQDPRFTQLFERARAAATAATATEAREGLSATALFPYDFTITTLDGRHLSLADLRGKVVIVDYWGTWCPPCRAEVPHFVALRKELGDKLAVVGMTWEHDRNGEAVIGGIKRFQAEVGIDYPLALIGSPDLQKVPGLEAFPTTLFIDKQGRVRAKEVGLRDLDALRAIVQALDAEPAPPTGPPPAPVPGPY